jgi:hypothetical protein
MIVEKRKDLADVRIGRDVDDPVDPRQQFLRRVQIVVAGLIGSVPPRRGIAPVEANVGDLARDVGTLAHQRLEVGLIDIDDADLQGVQEFERLMRLPIPMPELGDEFHIVQRFPEHAQIRTRIRAGPESSWKLHQHAGEFSGVDQRIDAAAKRPYIGVDAPRRGIRHVRRS